MDTVINRFSNIKGKNMTPSSLKIYRTRFSNALENFTSWATDSVNYKPDVTNRGEGKTQSKGSKKKKPSSSQKAEDKKTEVTAPHIQRTPDSVVFPVPLSDGRVVTIHNLPNNLLKKDAERICAVVMALSTTEEVR